MTKPTPTGRVIEASAGASAGAAEFTNKPKTKVTEELAADVAPFYVREEIHHRMLANGRQTMVEYALTAGEFPEGWPRFQGTGTLQAEVEGKPHTENFRFAIVADDLAGAWEKYDETAAEAAKQAEVRFREKLTAFLAQQQGQQIVRPNAAEVKAVEKTKGVSGLVLPGS